MKMYGTEIKGLTNVHMSALKTQGLGGAADMIAALEGFGSTELRRALGLPFGVAGALYKAARVATEQCREMGFEDYIVAIWAQHLDTGVADIYGRLRRLRGLLEPGSERSIPETGTLEDITFLAGEGGRAGLSA